MIAKIITCPYSGISPGDRGEVMEDMGGGYAIKLKQQYTKQFGGADAERITTLYFTKQEVEIIPDEPKTS